MYLNKKKGKVMKSKVEVNQSLLWSLGIALAVSISWTAHKSVMWAIIHGILNWVYVIYYMAIN
tara:strand:+ start:338 stop:526 length:189 start_codon:yes stop_codon:yes gene_type:complete